MENKMIALALPVPPEPILEQAVGYRNDRNARYLALWWEPCGDEAMVSDGFITFTGHWPGYLTYVQHVSIHPHLAAFQLGSSEDAATHRLVIDLRERQVFAASCREAEMLLANQWNTPQGEDQENSMQTGPVTLTIEDLQRLIEKLTGHLNQVPSMNEVMSRMEEDQKAVRMLQQWLDDQMK